MNFEQNRHIRRSCGDSKQIMHINVSSWSSDSILVSYDEFKSEINLLDRFRIFFGISVYHAENLKRRIEIEFLPYYTDNAH